MKVVAPIWQLLSSITISYTHSAQYSQRMAAMHRRPGHRFIDARKCDPGVGPYHGAPSTMFSLHYVPRHLSFIRSTSSTSSSSYTSSTYIYTLHRTTPVFTVAFARGDSAPWAQSPGDASPPMQNDAVSTTTSPLSADRAFVEVDTSGGGHHWLDNSGDTTTPRVEVVGTSTWTAPGGETGAEQLGVTHQNVAHSVCPCVSRD